jgi:hypothetical protein
MHIFYFDFFFAQIAEANAFTQLIEEKLDPAWKYLLWIDTKNHLEFTRLACLKRRGASQTD